MPANFPKTKSRKKPDWKGLIAAHSPYLASLAPMEGKEGADAVFEKLLRLPAKLTETGRTLRQLKKKAARIVAVADLKGEWDDLKAMRQLSRFADFCVKAALRDVLLEAHDADKIKLQNPKKPEVGCGVTVIALGKWGAFELNYSSDIDLMVIFDPQTAPVVDRDETQAFFTRLTRKLSGLLDDATADGYVFRTDLRLRPDPGAMPLAVSIAAVEAYYGSLGQNWERAAMIKARPVAGDEKLGADFMAIMESWIWRRNLDFAAIQDINSIKRQINAKVAHKEKAENPFLGYNVKLGHGGIREIEFFAQTQQLIYGGREPGLRVPDTLSALKALARLRHIKAATCAELTAAYLFLRRVEHRLQMQEDRQTHTLPVDQAAFADVAAFLEYTTATDFRADLKRHTDSVKKLYAELFTESPSLADTTGNLVFTGVDDDPETLVTLADMGFAAPEKITAAVRGWHHGRYRAMRTERARQLLTEVAPLLLETLSRTAHPDEAFLHFDSFLSHLPAGIPIFSMFVHNPGLLELVAGIMGASPVMAEYLGARPEVLEGLLNKDLFGPLPDVAQLTAILEARLAAARDYQDILDITRKFAREKRFHVGLHILQNLSPNIDCGACLADIAETVLTCLVPRVEAEFAATHGTFKSGEFIVIAMGSFAGRRMFTDSDLDIVMLYDISAKEEASSGGKPLPPNVYYIRLAQRLIAALTAPTAEGTLYDADPRLRPHGEKGPLAFQLSSYFDYQKKEAWTWEHMSLVRSRPVYASAAARKKINAERLKVLSRKRAPAALKTEVREMREKVDAQFGSKDPWGLKYVRGGMMDTMFIAHYLALKSGCKDVFEPEVSACLAALRKEKQLTAKDCAILLQAYEQALTVTGFLYLCAAMPFKPEGATGGLKKALVARSLEGKGSFKSLTADIKKNCNAAHAVYKKILG